MTVDVVVVAYNTGKRLVSCLQSVEGLGGRTVVIDHGDGADAARAEELGATVVLDSSNPGFGAGQNRGVALGQAPYVLLCNPDLEVDAIAVRAGAALLEREAHVAAVQGAVIHRGSDRPERSQGRELGPAHLVGRALGARRLLAFRCVRSLARRSSVLRDHVDRVPTAPQAVESLAATVLLVRRQAFEEVAGFDPSYFLYGEDLDLCRRLRSAGWTLIAVPECWAVHEGGASSSSWYEREVEWWRGTMRFAASWWQEPAWGVAAIAAFVRWVTVALMRPNRARKAFVAMVAEPWRVRRAYARRCRLIRQRSAPSREGGT